MQLNVPVWRVFFFFLFAESHVRSEPLSTQEGRITVRRERLKAAGGRQRSREKREKTESFFLPSAATAARMHAIQRTKLDRGPSFSLVRAERGGRKKRERTSWEKCSKVQKRKKKLTQNKPRSVRSDSNGFGDGGLGGGVWKRNFRRCRKDQFCPTVIGKNKVSLVFFFVLFRFGFSKSS